MTSIVDWLSFTLPVLLEAPTEQAYALAIERAFYDFCGQAVTDVIFGGKWEHVEKGRQPYSDTWKRKDAPIVMFTSKNLRHMTVEFSGQGCEWLRENGYFDELLRCVAERVTRIDVATDIQTEVTPSQFVDAGVSNRFSGRGIYTSQTGETVYVGSQKSERFARVYRYAAPHPRSNLLRVECVSRRDIAKIVAGELVNSSIEDVAARLGKSFAWKHDAWTLRDDETQPLTLVRERRETGGTVRWLMTSVAPAFKRLVADGTIRDAREFVEAVFLSDGGDTLS